MAQHDPRIAQIEHDIAKSSLSDAEKAILVDDLDYAVRLNGSNDDVKIGLKKLTLSLIRTRLAAPDATKAIVKAAVTEAVKAQVDKCKATFSGYTSQESVDVPVADVPVILTSRYAEMYSHVWEASGVAEFIVPHRNSWMGMRYTDLLGKINELGPAWIDNADVVDAWAEYWRDVGAQIKRMEDRGVRR